MLNHRIMQAQKYKKTGNKGLFDEQVMRLNILITK
jgi:hypothetical protein